MKTTMKIFLGIAIALGILGGIVFIRYWYTAVPEQSNGPDIVATRPDDSSTSTDISTSRPPIISQTDSSGLTKEQCEAARGHWNDCGSLCRSEPLGTICAEVCVNYCECGDMAKYECPVGYTCTDYVPGPQDPFAVGICKPFDPMPAYTEYKSSDEWTSFVLPEGTLLSNPFTFYGTTTAFENQISWRLLDDDGFEISSGYTDVHSPDMGIPGPFSVTAFFDKLPTSQHGMLEVLEFSAKDGTPVHVARAPVDFPLGRDTVTVYFGNSELASPGDECESIYAVDREVMLVKDFTAVAIHELLKGPTETEADDGYLTALPAGIPDPEISYQKNGTFLNFTDALEYQVGGSCRVQLIRAQIEQTAKDATEDAEIVVSIDGRTDDILQP